MQIVSAIVTGAVIFLIFWCFILFMVLPLGLQNEENHEAGWDRGAPRETHIRAKLIGSAVIALILVFVFRLVKPLIDWP